MRRLACRVLDAHGLVRAGARPEDLRHEGDRVERHGHLGRVLAVFVGDAIGVVHVEEHWRARLQVARRRVGAALGLHERAEGVVQLERLEDGHLDGLALEVVLLTTNLEIDGKRHHLGRAELVRPRAHVSWPQITVKEQEDDELGGHGHASNPDDGVTLGQVLVVVLHAAQVEERGRLADVHRLCTSHLVVGLRGHVATPSALDDLVLVHRDAPEVHVEIALVVEDPAVRRRVRVDRRPHVDAWLGVILELGAARLTVHQCFGLRAEGEKAAAEEVLGAVVDHGRRHVRRLRVDRVVLSM